MEKPKLFKNKNVSTNNNEEYCFLQNVDDNFNNNLDELDSIFNSFSNIYNTRVIIKTKDRVYNTYLYSRTKNNIMTIKREIIPIKDIISIELK